MPDPDQATASVLVDGFPLASAGVEPQQRLAINLTRGMVLRGMYAALPAQRCVADLPPQFNDPAYLQACQTLKESGFLLAAEVPAKSELVQLADIIRVDSLRFEPAGLVSVANQLRKLPCLKLAQRVETEESYQRLLALGFDLFQGYHFSRPQIIPGSTPSLSKVAKLRILRELSDDDFSMHDITAMISADVGLSFRLIRFINSPYFGFDKRITSVGHAASLLGQKPLRQWLMAVTLADICDGHHAREIYFFCIKRARFFELLGLQHSTLKTRTESLFLLGLFSKLDMLLGQSMAELMPLLNLEEDITQALCGGQNLLYGFLCLADGLEKAQWGELAPLIQQLGLSVADVARSHNMAILWAAEIMEEAKESLGQAR